MAIAIDRSFPRIAMNPAHVRTQSMQLALVAETTRAAAVHVSVGKLAVQHVYQETMENQR